MFHNTKADLTRNSGYGDYGDISNLEISKTGAIILCSSCHIIMMAQQFLV